ncbi:hypothetical protein M0R45_019843 [Rubus argutus]|uniref:Ribosome-inactivating protein n=1 Tax=Rubus argutus TaxID=59490 RepID=A0AAW1X6Z2_RUBAR
MNSVLVSLCLVLAIYLGIVHNAEANTSFSTVNATSDTYRDFITTLRSNLTARGTIMYDIPVLRESVPDSEPDERFVLVDLSNTNDTITVAVDVVTLHVAGFSNGEYSYFLADAHPAALNYLFNHTTPFPQLRFGGSFSDLESAANQSREEIVKGIIPLQEAITALFNTTTDRASKATSLIVVIKMVVERAKFKWAEQRFRDCIQIKCSLITGPTVLSLEEKWSDLSFEIQSSYNGLFRTTIELVNRTLGPWPVSNAWSNVCIGVAIQLFRCSPKSILRMPVDQLDSYDSTMCTPVASTTHISGANGLCVDVKNGNGSDGNAVQLWQCGEQSSQRWTFEIDGTIHSLGKCLAINDGSNYVIITNCTTAISSAIKWALSSDGTISNPSSGLVLTVPTSAAGTNLTVETNAVFPLQGWTVGEDVNARVCIIKGYGNNCWTGSGSILSLEGCIVSKNDEQYWAFYNDGTIRLDSNRSLCVNSEGHESGANITLVQCKGTWSGQRWVFKADGTVLNPYTNLVIDGIEQFVLSKSNGNMSQQFLPYF